MQLARFLYSCVCVAQRKRNDEVEYERINLGL